MRGHFRWTIDAPHFFKVVELTNLGTEHVDDQIAGINEHPVTSFSAFDTRASKALSF